MKYLAALLVALLPILSDARPLLKEPRVNLPVQNLDIDSSRMVRLDGPVNDDTVGEVLQAFDKLDSKTKPIYFVINSPGGSVSSGLELIRRMETLDSKLTCVVEFRAYSMAAIIAAYCPTLLVYKFGMVMFHEASYAQQGKQSEQVRKVNVVERYFDEVYTDIANRLGMTLEEYKKRIHDEWWLTAGEAVKSGFADGIVLRLKYKTPRNSALQKLIDSLSK